MEYRIKKDIVGSPDGIHTREYKEGDIVTEKELSAYLIEVWTENGIITSNEDIKNDDAEDIKNDDVSQMRELLGAENIDTNKLKELGVKLGIKNMYKTVNPNSIIEKANRYLQEIEG